MDPTEKAEKGDVEFFKTVNVEVLKNARDLHSRSALDCAIICEHHDCVEEICQRCPELIYNQDNDGITALHWAVMFGHVSTVAVLLNTAVKVNLENETTERKITRLLDKLKESPLYYAVEYSTLEVVKYLLEADPEFVPAPDVDSRTPLSLARDSSNSRSAKMLELLIENEKYQNWTPLQKATARGDIEAVKEIMDSSPNEIDIVDGENRNFVHVAAKFGRTEIIKFLLKEADLSARVLNAEDKYGNTPLLIAGLFGNISTATCLLYDSRVPREAVNSYGQNVLDAVFASGQEKAKNRELELQPSGVKLSMQAPLESPKYAAELH